MAVQLIFENRQMRFEPHPTLRDRINELGMELSTRGYDGQQTAVQTLIDATRTSLTSIDGQVGPWEAECLEYAETAIRDNFLRLALTQVEKAIEVSELPRKEYKAGFNYTSHR